MGDNSPSEMFLLITNAMGMIEQLNGLNGCGRMFVGDGVTTKGYFWFFDHENYFAVSKCDFIFLKDTHLKSPPNFLYIALRLDSANHLPPGKIVSFMEEHGSDTQTVMKKGARVAYTEVIYFPSFYKKHLDSCFSNLEENPVEILKNMGGDHNWPPEMLKILTALQTSTLHGMTAELYFVAKAYELMSMLIMMGSIRSPKNTADYDRILAVIEHIDHNYKGRICQGDLVRLSSMSGTKLKSLFKQFTGKTITDYILERKSDCAAHLLSGTTLSIEEISGQVGFSTAAGFATSFKKQVGISPSEYRKQMKFNCMYDPSQQEMVVLN